MNGNSHKHAGKRRKPIENPRTPQPVPTLSLDVSADRRTLYVHAMFVDDPEALRQELKTGMEQSVIEAVK